MNAEQIIYQALAPLADGRVFADVADEGTSLPWIVYQTVGGDIPVTLDNRPTKVCQRRVQVVVWCATRADTATLMRRVFYALVNPSVGAVPLGAPVNIFEHETLLYGSRLELSLGCTF
jgi:hypothetical protein